jgi:hypothetical protein
VGTSHSHKDNRRRVASAGRFYTLQFATRLLNFNTGASQSESAASAPPPIGSHSAQRKWNKIGASAGQSQSINIHDSALQRESVTPVHQCHHDQQSVQIGSTSSKLRPRREFITAPAPTGVSSNSTHPRQSALPA